MEIAGEYTFDAPQQLVWEAVQDPDVLGSVMPGGEGFVQTGENAYSGKLKIKVGPVQGVFEGSIQLSDIVAPESYTIEVDGKGAPGFVKATGSMKLEPHGTNQTHMQYSGKVQIGGRIASVGQRLLDSSARSIIRQSLDGLNAYLKVKATQQQAQEAAPVSEAGGAAQPAVPDYRPPSQMQVGLNVMRDVFNDLVPPAMRPVLVIGGIAVIAIIIWLIVR